MNLALKKMLRTMLPTWDEPEINENEVIDKDGDGDIDFDGDYVEDSNAEQCDYEQGREGTEQVEQGLTTDGPESRRPDSVGCF